MNKCLYAVVSFLLLSSLIKAQNQSRPNVVFMVVDDMNTWSLLKDYAPLQTPYIDKLKSQSLYFKNAVCPVPVCIPSLGGKKELQTED